MLKMSKKDWSSDELDTLRRSRSPTVVLTAGGELQTNEEAQVFVHDLNLFVTVQILQETPAVLSLGKLCEDQRREDNCLQNGQLRTSCCSMVISQFWKQFVVDIGIAGFVNNSCSRTKQRTRSRRLVQVTVKNPKRKIKRGMTIEIRTTVCEIFLNSLEDFTDNGSACTRTRFSGLRFGTSHESGIKIKEVQYLYSVPKRPKLRHVLQNQNDKGSLQKTHWRSSTLSRKVCWLDDGRSQGPQWGRWISKQSSICCRGTRFGNSTQSIPSVQNQNFSQNRKEFTKVPRAVAKTRSCKKTDNSLEFGKSCEDLHGIIEHQYLTDPRRMLLLKKRYAEKRTDLQQYCRNLDGKVVGWFYGMLLLSAKRSKPLGRRENSVWKAIWRTTQRANNPFWSNGWISSYFNVRFIKTSSIWQESITWDLSWVWADRGGDILIVDLEDLEKLDASEIHLRRKSTRKKHKKKMNSCSGYQMAQQHCQEATTNSENPLQDGNKPKGVSTCRNNRWRWSPLPTRTSSIVITMNLEFNSLCRKKKHSPSHQKYIDVTRSTHSDLDVVQEKRIYDKWNVDSNRSLSVSWKGFTKFT